MAWLLIALTAWAAVAIALALAVGRAVKVADERDGRPCSAVPDHVPAAWTVPAAGSR